MSIRQLRDGFPWYLGTDVFNTERLELSRGPGGLAYGDVDAGGIINIVTKRARFQRQGSAQVRFDSFGTQRFSIDYNQPVLDGRLAVRVNAINSAVRQWKERKGLDLEAYAGAVRWEPFKNRRTQIDAMFEMGRSTRLLSHLQLNDARIAYVPGTGTNAVDANPAAPGVQMNGVGMKRVQPVGAHAFFEIDGVLYNWSHPRRSRTGSRSCSATSRSTSPAERIRRIRTATGCFRFPKASCRCARTGAGRTTSIRRGTTPIRSNSNTRS